MFQKLKGVIVASVYQKLLFYYGYRRQKSHVKNRPLKIWIEPTNACNLECKICPQSSGDFPLKGVMDISLMRKIASELRSIHPLLVTLHLSGEPLLHPNIAAFVKILKKEDLNVTFSTNGVLLTREKCEELIDAGLDDLRIDFAADRKRYEEIRKRAVWEVVHNNLLTLLELKKDRNILKPRLLIVNIDLAEDEERTNANLDNLRNMFKNYPAEIVNLESHTWAGEFARSKMGDPLFENVQAREERNYFPCPHIFGSFVITWNGDVVPCCRDLKKDYVIGNIKEQPIMALWNSERLVRLREKQILRQYADIPLCSACTQLWSGHTFSKFAKNAFRKTLYLKFGKSYFGSRKKNSYDKSRS